jgi:tetratricopeptide (TPR) repeat protein
MSEKTEGLALQPVVRYPQTAQIGGTYLLTVDLRQKPLEEWPFAEEEHVVHCVVEAHPLFSVRPVDEGAVILHRFGGTYGPARFLLTAREVGRGTITVALANQWEVPIASADLGPVTVSGTAVTPQARPVAYVAAEPVRPPTSPPRVPVVLILYSHDSLEHQESVLALSERLRHEGVDTRLDQYVATSPTEGWPLWVQNQLDEADCALVVCTETYYDRFHRVGEPPAGKGTEWEATLLAQKLYENPHASRKFIPVLLASGEQEFIPEPLRGHRHYVLTAEAEYDALLQFLYDVGRSPRTFKELPDDPWVDIESRTTAQHEGAEAEGELPRNSATAVVVPTRLRHGAVNLVGREEEIAALDAAWNDPQTNVLTIVGWGGVGKTTLVSMWASGLAARAYDGARYFDWSFYSQGTRDTGTALSDQFVMKALEFFGDPEMARSAASPWDKGAHLAELIAQQRTLLVLDGLEPLQYPPGPLAGELRDPAMSSLLRGLAQQNLGLCVITTRERVTDLARYNGTTTLQLESLTIPAGIELLKSLGVQGSHAELMELVQDVGGHALTLLMLGSYLARAHGGDVRRRDLVPFERADAVIQGGHGFRVMAAYEKWLAHGGEEGLRQLALLYLMGLFDRPADGSSLSALRSAPAISGLTEPLVDLAEEDWNLSVAALADSSLVSVQPESLVIDAHPLIREYFGKRLRDLNPNGWREAHNRLYKHLIESVEYRPDTLDRLQPLYQAVTHGCLAGRYREVLEIYRDRIQRGPEAYAFKSLGAVGANLAAIAGFFETRWSLVKSSVAEPDQVWLLNEAAFYLRALGRVSEALQPLRVSLQSHIEKEDWRNASITAGNLSTLALSLGDVTSAMVDAEQSVSYADRTNDTHMRVSSLAMLADALHQAGRRDEARAQFGSSEALQAELAPQYPLLYSLNGFRYCDSLLADAERVAWQMMLGGREKRGAQHDQNSMEHLNCREVERRARQTLEWALQQRWLLDTALDHLTLARAALYVDILTSSGSHMRLNDATRREGAAALDGLRRAGHVDHLAAGLLTRAWQHCIQGEMIAARTDLDEAWQIAERGPMRLHIADLHLYRARLFHAIQPYPWESPQVDLTAARRLVEECGYWRRKDELEDAEAAARAWSAR